MERSHLAKVVFSVWLLVPFLAEAQDGARPKVDRQPEEATPPAKGEAAPSPEEAEENADRAAQNLVEIEEPQRPRYIVESIEVRGNTKTRGDLVISTLFFKPGESLDEEKVEVSRIRLLALGYFKDVRMKLERGSVRGRVKLVVEVEERNTILIDDLFLGFSPTNPVWGGLAMSDINFLGRGLVLSAAAVGSEFQQAYRLGMFWPAVFNTKLQTGFQLLFTRGRERALLEDLTKVSAPPECDFTTDQELQYYRAGGIFSGGMRVDRLHRIAFDLHVEYINANADQPGSGCENYPFLDYIQNNRSTLSSLTFRFERDTRDDFFLPTRGMLLTISVELASAILGSTYEYSKYMIRYEHSFPAFADHALRLAVVGGLIQDVGKRGSPFFSRFFVGDYALFWVDKGSLPRNVELNFSENANYGDVLLSIGLEYDIPIWSTGRFFYRAYLYGAANYTYVTKAAFLAIEEEWSGRPTHPLTADFGLKLDTPVGLLRFSLGYLVDLAF